MNPIKDTLKKLKSAKNAVKNSDEAIHQKTVEPSLQDDIDLFAKAMQDVKPLNEQNRVSVFEARANQTTQQHLRKIRHKQSSKPNPLKFQELDSTHPIGAFETMNYFEAGLRTQDLTKLKRSHFFLEASLDLHGKTAEEAEMAIEHFISQAIECKMKYVRIIHGKGYNSDSEFPVLKNLCYQKLKTLKNIVGFCSAPEKDGGVGAVNIQLKTK